MIEILGLKADKVFMSIRKLEFKSIRDISIERDNFKLGDLEIRGILTTKYSTTNPPEYDIEIIENGKLVMRIRGVREDPGSGWFERPFSAKSIEKVKDGRNISTST